MQRPHAESTAGSSHAAAAGVIYAAAYVTVAIEMSFEMLGSRYLNPYFGSGIYTWAALISTVLIALTAGYFLGGALADRTASLAVLALTVIVGSLYLLALPSFAQAVLEFVLESVDDIRAGSLIASLALMFFPVTFLGMYSPFAIRLLLRSPQRSGRVSGAVYGVSTAGAIVGTLGTTSFSFRRSALAPSRSRSARSDWPRVWRCWRWLACAAAPAASSWSLRLPCLRRLPAAPTI